MSQFDFGVIDPYVVDGVQLADDLNQFRDALFSYHRGPTRPPYAVPGMLWVNDAAGPANWILNVYLSPTIGDRPLFTYDTTTGNITVAIGAGGAVSAAVLLAQAAAGPSVQWNATANPIDAKNWRMTENGAGALVLASYSDAGVLQQSITFNRDGTMATSAGGGSFIGIPPGAMMDWPGAAAPGGWLLAAGQIVSRATYAGIFAAYGTLYGAGDGSTTFGLPDCRGRVTAGADNMNGPAAGRLGSGRPGGVTVPAAVGVAGGEQSHVSVTNETASHTHPIVAGAGLVVYGNTGAGVATLAAGGDVPLYTTTLAPVPAAVNQQAFNTTQPTLVVNKIIKI